MSFGFGFGITATGKAGFSPAFSPASLFASGEEGVWYDPSDFSTMYQYSDGRSTDPVTAVEQPVGLILDKSQGLTLGSEVAPSLSSYQTVLTGTWAASGSDYAFTDTVGGQSRPGAQWPTVSLTAGWYRLTIVVSSITGASQIRVDGVGASDLLIGVGTHTFTVNVTTTSRPRFRIEDLSTSINDGFALSSVSVKALPGNHASQSTSAARPVLRARYNLLTYSEQFDNAAWTAKTGLLAFGSGSTANAITAPDGTTTADLITMDSSTGAHNLRQDLGTSSTGNSTASVFLKYKDWQYVGLQGPDSNNSVIVDLVNGTVVSSGSSTSNATMTAVGNGWYRLSFSMPQARYYILGFNGNTTSYQNSFTGDGSSGFYAWGAQLIITNSLTSNAYQRIAAATDYVTTSTMGGATFLPYLDFDGSDDALATASIDFSATDEMSVFAGVTKLSDANAGVVVTLADTTTTDGSFILYDMNGAYYYLRSRGTAPSNAQTSTSYPAPGNYAVTGLMDISNDSNALRVDGADDGTAATDQGTGNYRNGALTIGNLGAGGAPWQGSIYSLIVRNKTSTVDEIDDTEAYVAGKTGITL